MTTYSDTATDLVINRCTKTQFESATGLDPTQSYEVDPEFSGNKLLATDANGDIVESSISASGVVTDVKNSSGTSIVTDGVATLPALTLVTIRRFA